MRDDETLLTVSELGFGKRTAAAEYRLTHRGGKGVITMNVTDKTGKVISVRQVGIDDQVVLITDGGKVIRLDVKHRANHRAQRAGRAPGEAGSGRARARSGRIGGARR